MVEASFERHLLERSTVREKSPEVCMWTKCLALGVLQFLRGPSKKFEKSTRWLADAWWLLCDANDDEVGSFNWICAHTGISPTWLRRLALDHYPEDSTEIMEHLRRLRWDF